MWLALHVVQPWVRSVTQAERKATAAFTSFHHPSIPPFIYSSFWASAVNNGLTYRERSAGILRLVIRYAVILNQMVFMLQGWRRGLDASFSVLEHPCSLVDTEEEMWDVHDVKTQWYQLRLGWCVNIFIEKFVDLFVRLHTKFSCLLWYLIYIMVYGAFLYSDYWVVYFLRAVVHDSISVILRKHGLLTVILKAIRIFFLFL